MKKIILAFVILTTLALTSCNYFARKWGGNVTVNLEPGEKLVEATWKDANLWYLVEPMEDDYVPKTKIFKEASLYGVCEGQVTFIETR